MKDDDSAAMAEAWEAARSGIDVADAGIPEAEMSPVLAEVIKKRPIEALFNGG